MLFIVYVYIDVRVLILFYFFSCFFFWWLIVYNLIIYKSFCDKWKLVLKSEYFFVLIYYDEKKVC